MKKILILAVLLMAAAGIAALRTADHVDAGALCPLFELLRRRRAERVRRRDEDLLSLRPVDGRELADRRRLANAVDADHEDDGRFSMISSVAWMPMSSMMRTSSSSS